VKLDRLRKPKIIYSSSYAYFRPKNISVILLKMGHMLRGEQVLEE
jgi:hypothetical protein